LLRPSPCSFPSRSLLPLFSFTHPSTLEIYSLSLHDALPISELSILFVRGIFQYLFLCNPLFRFVFTQHIFHFDTMCCRLYTVCMYLTQLIFKNSHITQMLCQHIRFFFSYCNSC